MLIFSKYVIFFSRYSILEKISFLSKSKMSKCYYCGEVMRDENLKTHCKNAHKAAKRIAGERSVEGFFTPPFQPKESKTSTVSSASTSGEIHL